MKKFISFFLNMILLFLTLFFLVDLKKKYIQANPKTDVKKKN